VEPKPGDEGGGGNGNGEQPEVKEITPVKGDGAN
jgi:hypothetical protein